NGLERGGGTVSEREREVDGLHADRPADLGFRAVWPAARAPSTPNTPPTARRLLAPLGRHLAAAMMFSPVSNDPSTCLASLSRYEPIVIPFRAIPPGCSPGALLDEVDDVEHRQVQGDDHAADADAHHDDQQRLDERRH